MIADREEFERKLLAVVSLPWLRYGIMPDWLRTKLVASITPAAEQIVRQALEKLLVTFLNPPPDGIRLDYATRQKDTTLPHGWRGAWHKLRQSWAARRRRRKVRELLRTESSDSPLQDFVFLTFMSGRRPGSLDVSVPDLLRQVLFPRGLEAFGPRPAAALACAALVSFGGWVTASTLAPSGLLPPVPIEIAPGPPPFLPIFSSSPAAKTSPNPCPNAPVINISDVSSVEERDTISLIAAVAGVDAEKYADAPFDWSVRDDTGKPIQFGERPDARANILIQTDGLGGRTITAVVLYDWITHCTTSASTSVFVNPRGEGAVQLSLRTQNPQLFRNSYFIWVDGNQTDQLVSVSTEPIVRLKPGRHEVAIVPWRDRVAITVDVVAGKWQRVVLALPDGPVPEPSPTPSPTPAASPLPRPLRLWLHHHRRRSARLQRQL